MFNRKRTKARELRRIVEETHAELVKVNGQCTHYRQQTDALRTERDELLKANGELKRELYEQEQKCEKLKSDLTGAAALLEETQKKLTGDTDLQALKDKVLVEVARDLACPSDCTKHANPGPGGNICRNCIRNPRAVDKYTNGKYTPENGKE